MKFIADLHIHSRFSRATAKNLNFENLYLAARTKGITVVGTGDFTHPGWLSEIREQLEPAEPGLFRLKDDLAQACEKKLRIPGHRHVRFLLSSEISTIYKKAGATRKLHHLVFFSDIFHVERFNARLERIGNLKSDGRPILGLDSRILLEIVLETAPEGFLIPAHIWTPWFSLYGSKSGFDSIRECFDDLSGHIFAAETGLSSDPPMNWRVADLDRITLVSNSDAHSPANLGREANLFTTGLSYGEIKTALQTGNPEAFGGTLEFFPEEGKYHQDGHRKCGVNFHPRETLEIGGKCPVCGHPLTLGVLYRVEQLANRAEGEKSDRARPFYSMIPLAEILSEIYGCGAKSKKVEAAYRTVIESLGPELDILLDTPADTIASAGIPLLDEAISRMRQGRVHVNPGYDGEYGRITLFTPDERSELIGQKSLFVIPDVKPTKDPNPPESPFAKGDFKDEKRKIRISGTATGDRQACDDPAEATKPENLLSGLNDAQLQAVLHPGGPLLIVAGPGTGKTRTLTCRIARLIKDSIANPGDILAVTFTNKAAREMAGRLEKMLGEASLLPRVATFHALCYDLLKEIEQTDDYGIIDDIDRRSLVSQAIDHVKQSGTKVGIPVDAAVDCIVAAKQKILSPSDDLSSVAGGADAQALAAVYAIYQEQLALYHLYDYEDLIYRMVVHLESDEPLRRNLQDRYRYLFIDEYQDLNHAQYRLVRLLKPARGDICVIGDPDQSIYGFRGADATFFQRFTADYPEAAVFRLDRNYRSARPILSAAGQIIEPHSIDDSRRPVYSQIDGKPHIGVIVAETGQGEAVAIGKTIEQMIGGMGFDFHDFGKHRHDKSGERSFSDFAVLYRTRAQGDIFADVFDKAGIPFQRANKESVLSLQGVCEPVCALKILEGCGRFHDLGQLTGAMAPGLNRKDQQVLTRLGSHRRLSIDSLASEIGCGRVEGLSKAGGREMGRVFRTLSDLAAKTNSLTVSDKLGIIMEFLGPMLPPPGQKAEEGLKYLLTLAANSGADAPLFLKNLALETDPDFLGDSRSEKVALLTLHAAKGLEFPVVFVAGCEDGLIPFHRQNRDSDPAEERRLFYVAVTRAADELYLCRARKRTYYGRNESYPPSPFLSEIDPQLLKFAEQGAFIPKPKQVQLTLFS